VHAGPQVQAAALAGRLPVALLMPAGMPVPPARAAGQWRSAGEARQ
jgi:hypothetical protein